jgi:osmotically-inducible protein OsmY
MLDTAIPKSDDTILFHPPITLSAADRELERRLRIFLATRQVGELRRLSVSVRHGNVRLCGRVGSFYHRQLAVSVTGKVAGVLTVEDEITVVPAAR